MKQQEKNPGKIEIDYLKSFPKITGKCDLVAQIINTSKREHFDLKTGDIICIASKVISKSLGLYIDLRQINPSPLAWKIHEKIPRKDPRLIQVIINQTGDATGKKLDLANIKFDYILFVPLHKKRLRQRGFNQAEKIAMDLSKIVDIPTVDNISRKYNTKRLYKLGKEERINELKNAFMIKDNRIDLKNKNVLLVDDIFTTGSTVNEISKILKINGVNKVFVSTFLTRTDTFYVKA